MCQTILEFIGLNERCHHISPFDWLGDAKISYGVLSDVNDTSTMACE